MSSSVDSKGGKRRRGVHRKASSPETRRWAEQHLIPKRPPWMDTKTYRWLAGLRAELERR